MHRNSAVILGRTPCERSCSGRHGRRWRAGRAVRRADSKTSGWFRGSPAEFRSSPAPSVWKLFERAFHAHPSRAFEQHRVSRLRQPAGRNSPAEPGPRRTGVSRTPSAAAASTISRACPADAIRTSTPCRAAYAPTWRCSAPAAAPSSSISPSTGERRAARVWLRYVDHPLRPLPDSSCNSRSRTTMPLCTERPPRMASTVKLSNRLAERLRRISRPRHSQCSQQIHHRVPARESWSRSRHPGREPRPAPLADTFSARTSPLPKNETSPNARRARRETAYARVVCVQHRLRRPVAAFDQFPLRRRDAFIESKDSTCAYPTLVTTPISAAP